MTVLLFLLVLVTTAIVLAITFSATIRGSTQAKLRHEERDRNLHDPGSPDVFACKLIDKSRLTNDIRWPRRRARAMWVHDVLFVRTSHLWPQFTALPVRLPEDNIRDARPHEISGLGNYPVVITLRLDDGRMIDVAASEDDRSLLAGPFCVAAIHGLGPGRVERLPRKPADPSRRPDRRRQD